MTRFLGVAFVLLLAVTLGQAAPVKPAVKDRLQAFPLTQVRLLDGPLKTALEANRKYLRMLDADRMLYAFRRNAGLPAVGKPLGGWEAPDCEVRGHFVGHFLSACALMYSATGDQELKAKADYMIAEMAKCQKALATQSPADAGYLSAFPASFWDRLEAMKGPPWAPYYTIHKIMAGLLDMHTMTGNQQALDIVKGMAGYFKGRFDKLTIWQTDQLLTVEFGGMAEVLHSLYAVTGDPDHLALGHTFEKNTFLGPLALEHDDLTNIHANTHIPQVAGAARRYEVTGDERYRTIASYFWDRVANHRSYATGGSNVGEGWGDPDKLAGTLTPNNEESCTTYNMLKIARYLLRWTADPRYADYYAHAFINGIIGTQNPEDGMLLYYLPLATGNAKNWGTAYDSFWCCTGTGVETFSKLGDSIYFHDAGNLYVNMPIASTVDWTAKGVKVEQLTRYPREEGTSFIVHCPRSVEFGLKVLVPHWATRGVAATVNGQPVDIGRGDGSRRGVSGRSSESGIGADGDPAHPPYYLTVQRTWRDGDRVTVKMPMRLYAAPMPDDPEMIAVMYGPLVLAGLTDHSRYFIADAKDLAAWIKPVPGKPLTFTTVGQKPEMTLVPLNGIINERYGVYFLAIKEGSERHKKLLAEEEARRQREARFLDRVLANDATSEQAHHLQEQGSGAGPYGGKGWRHAPSPGWFSWDLKVLPDAPITLVCTYWGSDVPPRQFDVLVDGQVIATQTLNSDKPGEFFDIEYKIPPELTRGKDKITVRFQGHPNNTAGGVFECGTLR
jgi:uncharacterized protein